MIGIDLEEIKKDIYSCYRKLPSTEDRLLKSFKMNLDIKEEIIMFAIEEHFTYITRRNITIDDIYYMLCSMKNKIKK